jgi:hypothetical protein
MKKSIVLSGMMALLSLVVALNASGNDQQTGLQLGGTRSGFHPDWDGVVDATQRQPKDIPVLSIVTDTKPNLTPYQPSGWSNKIVVSYYEGATSDAYPLYDTDDIYVNWAVINSSTVGITGEFYYDLYLDGFLIETWRSESLAGNYYSFVTDFWIGPLDAGKHTIKIVADPTHLVDESNEADNAYEKEITIVIEPSADEPNLIPYRPSGWSDVIVVSNVTGTTTDISPLYDTDTLYVDWAVVNSSSLGINTKFYSALYVDGNLKKSWYTNSLEPDYYTFVTDYSIGPLSAGTHQLKLVADSTGVINESSEADNTFEKEITVLAGTGAAKSNLTPYTPTAWSDKIVVSNVPETTTDAGTLYDSDELYVDWAAVNNGSLGISTKFYSALYVDDNLKKSWFSESLDANYYAYATDYSIGSLAAGTHRIKLVVDSTGAINESDEEDNEYTKTITVLLASPDKPNLAFYELKGSDEILVSKKSSASKDDFPLKPSDNLYVSWCIKNIGGVKTSREFTVSLYIDGLKTYSSLMGKGGLKPSKTLTKRGAKIGKLAEGEHELKLVIDEEGVIQEINKSDNIATKKIYIQSGEGAVTKPNLNGLTTIDISQLGEYEVQGSVCSKGGEVEYLLDWGDGNRTGWSADRKQRYAWSAEGTYLLGAVARCQDQPGIVSNWTVLPVSVAGHSDGGSD